MSQRALVTGGLGYLGSILCEHLLDAGFRVRAVDNLLYGQGQQGLFHLCAQPGFDFVKGDVRDESVMRSALKDVDVVIHLAAIVGASACDRDPGMATSVNLDAVKLLNRLRSPQQLVIYPNTNSGYGSTEGTSFCTEETPLEPISLYGKTKCEAEQHLLESQNAITLRLATVFGMSPRMRLDLLVNHFVHAALNDGYIVIFEKDFKRNYVHVRDVADCFLHCIANVVADGRQAVQRRARLGQPVEGGTGPEGEGIYLRTSTFTSPPSARTPTSGTTSSRASGCGRRASRPSGRSMTASKSSSKATA